MSSSEHIVSLDIGTHQIRAIIGEVANDTISIIGYGTATSSGIRKGAIVDIDLTARAIRQAVEDAERMVGIQIREVYVGIQGNHISLQSNRGVIAVQNADREIGPEDIERVQEAAKVITLQPEREIIAVLPKQYIVDGDDGITDPTGMIGTRLEIEATIVTTSRTALHNITRCLDKAGLDIAAFVLMSEAAGQVSLTKDERLLGTALVDIGAGSSTVSIFHNGHLVATSTIPIGGEHVTSDISYGLRTQTEHAEKIKLKYGTALISEAVSEFKFKVVRMDNHGEKEFTQVDLAKIIEPRMQEILDFNRAEVERLGYEHIVNGYVLIGGAVALPNTVPLAQSEFQSAVRIATPDFIGVRDPSYANGVGIIQFIYRTFRREDHVHPTNGRNGSSRNVRATKPKDGIVDKFKNFLGEFI